MASIASSWNLERRRLFLLNSEVEFPLSVDRNVWPALGLPKHSGIDETPIWKNQKLMRETLEGVNRIPKGIYVLITIYADELYRSSKHWRLYLDVEGVVSQYLEEDFLGYDVADAGLISAISNCGFSPQQKACLSAKFAPKLNEHGLFAELAVARNFQLDSNRRIKEHAPFFIHGLFVKRKLT